LAAASPWPEPLAEALEADASAVGQGLLQPECAAFYTPALGAPRALVLALHGFTAGPYQFSHLSERLASSGMACFAARLPGHGARLQTGEPSWKDLPGSRGLPDYVASASLAFERAHRLAQHLQVPLHLLGFSMGGALALDLALRTPRRIHRLVLLAPLLRAQGRMQRLAFGLLSRLQGVGLHRLIDRIPFSWGKLPTEPDWTRPGHWEFRLGNLFAVLSYGTQVHRHPMPLRVPTQLITSGADSRCDPLAAGRLLSRSTMPTFAYHFPAALQVPHAMLSPQENRSGQTLAQVETMIEHFLRTGEGSDNRRVVFRE
jgi:pimeloyl-ACP methyl ester carboxylesterase